MTEVGPAQDDCGYAVNPGVFEQFKFLFSHGCADNKDYPWPSKPADFKETVIGYYHFMEGLCRELCLTLADLVGKESGGDREEWEKLIDPRELPEGYFSNGDCRFFRYLGDSEMREEAFAGEVHADIGMVSIGPLSTVPGIQYFDRTDMVWRVPERIQELQGKPIIAVWTGDVVRCLTGGYLPGTVHRVKLDESIVEDRYSMPFFIRARNGVPIRNLAAKAVGNNDVNEAHENYTKFFEERFKRSQCTSFFNYLPPF